jgi:hypothetical protein
VFQIENYAFAAIWAKQYPNQNSTQADLCVDIKRFVSGFCGFFGSCKFLPPQL